MRYRLIDTTSKKKIVGSLAELKPISAYMHTWFKAIDYLYLQCQTKKGNKWRDYHPSISWYELQHKNFMNTLNISGLLSEIIEMKNEAKRD